MASGYVTPRIINVTLMRGWSILICDSPNSASLIIGLIIVVLASVVAWVFSPKGDNQTFVSLPLPPAILWEYKCVLTDCGWVLGSGGVRLFSRLFRVSLCGVSISPVRNVGVDG